MNAKSKRKHRTDRQYRNWAIATHMADDRQADVVRTANQAFELMNQLDPGDSCYKEAVAKMLMRVNPGEPFGTPLFNAVAELSWSLAFEAIALRLNEELGEPEVYLRRRASRADGETAHPGEWHCPGSVRRPGESWRQVADRLAKEFNTPIRSFQEINQIDVGVGGEERGSFMSFVFNVQLEDEPRQDERHAWFPVSRLPEKTVWSHRDIIIPMAVVNLAAKNRLPFRVSARFVPPKKKTAKKAANLK